LRGLCEIVQLAEKAIPDRSIKVTVDTLDCDTLITVTAVDVFTEKEEIIVKQTCHICNTKSVSKAISKIKKYLRVTYGLVGLLVTSDVFSYISNYADNLN
jgi:hypothetical protein